MSDGPRATDLVHALRTAAINGPAVITPELLTEAADLVERYARLLSAARQLVEKLLAMAETPFLACPSEYETATIVYDKGEGDICDGCGCPLSDHVGAAEFKALSALLEIDRGSEP
jgi:hypothetical protein